MNEIEKKLEDKVAETTIAVEGAIITNDEEYRQVAELAKNVKAVENEINAYWTPLKKEAYTPYKTICNKLKSMLAPVEELEALVKRKLADYLISKERESNKLIAQTTESAEKTLAEMKAKAEKLEGFDKEIALMEISQMEDVMAMTTLSAETRVRVDGISTQEKFVITITDPSLVPTEIGGTVIRPIDEKAIKKLVDATNGEINIPGVEINKDYIIKVSA